MYAMWLSRRKSAVRVMRMDDIVSVTYTVVDVPDKKQDPQKQTPNKQTPNRQIVLDTSTLLSDPDALTGFPDCDIVLPLTVIEELDGAKSRYDAQGAAARKVIRYLEKSRLQAGGDLQKKVSIGQNSTLRIEINGYKSQNVASMGLSLERNDNRIIATALAISSANADVCLVSVDVNMRVKASALGLTATDWQPVTLTSSRVHGWHCIQSSQDDIDTLYSQGKLRLAEDCVASVNEFVVLQANSSSALCVRTGEFLEKVTTQSPWGLSPRNKEQIFALHLLMDQNIPIVGLAGSAGTGKTILSLAAALEQIMEPASRVYERLVILRPIMAVGRQELGYLPGTLEEKLGPWFDTVVDATVALSDTLSHPQAKERLALWVQQGRLSMDAVTYLRGRSLNKSFIIVDEAQNLERLTLKTVLTRVGEGSKIVFLGDTSQIDNPYVSSDTNALSILMDKFKDQSMFGGLTLTKGERSKVASLTGSIL